MQLVDDNGNVFGGPFLEIIGPDGKPKTISSGTPIGPAGGDLSGTYPNPTVNWNNGLSTYNTAYYPLSSNPSGYISNITVGTTPVTSGTDGRIFFQSGGVVQQSGNLFWNNTNRDLQIDGIVSVGKSTLGVPYNPLVIDDIVDPNNALVSATRIYPKNFDNKRLFVGDTSRRFFSIDLANVNESVVNMPNLTIRAGNTISWIAGGALMTNNSGLPLQMSSYWGYQFRDYSNVEIAKIGYGPSDNKSTFNGNVSIGTTANAARLDIRAQGALSTDLILRTRNSADTRNFLVVNGAGDVYNNGAGGVTSNTFYGENVGRSATGTSNTFLGSQSGRDNTTGNNNSFFGSTSGQFNTTGLFNSFYGSSAGRFNTTGNVNSFFGAESGYNNTTGIDNTFIGAASGYNNTTGSNNCFLGRDSGRRVSGGANLTIANNSVFIGEDTRANADNETNQIVIGHNAIGTGSNSVTLGNTSITRTNLRGQVVISGFASAPTGVEGAIYYDSTTKKHYGFDGTNWNALY